MIHMTMVHGNDDVIEGDFDTLAMAHAAAVAIEDKRHGSSGDLRWRFPDFEHTDAGRGYQQFGTDYHYVMFEEKP